MPRFNFAARDRDGKLKNYGYLDMENQADGPATMTFYGDIVATESWPEDRAPQQIADFLAALAQGQQINLYFNSPGGDAYAGVAMHNILSRWQGRKVAYVDAIAASAATMPLMACDEIHLAAGAEVMIHDPLGLDGGQRRRAARGCGQAGQGGRPLRGYLHSPRSGGRDPRPAARGHARGNLAGRL